MGREILARCPGLRLCGRLLLQLRMRAWNPRRKENCRGEANWEGEASCRLWLWGAGAGRALLLREPVFFLAAQKRPVGCVWRGADPQAHPSSAIDCGAFPINYLLIMENRQCWFHGSGIWSHVVGAGKGAGQPCPHLPAARPACRQRLAAQGVGEQPPTCPLLRRAAGPGQAEGQRPLRCTG